MTNFKQFENNIPKSLIFFMHKAVSPFHSTIQKTEESAKAMPAFCTGNMWVPAWNKTKQNKKNPGLNFSKFDSDSVSCVLVWKVAAYTPHLLMVFIGIWSAHPKSELCCANCS